MSGEGLHLVGLHGDMVAEIEVAGVVERHEVDVGVGDVDADDGDAHLDAGAYLFKALGHATAEAVEGDEEVVVEVEDVVDLFFGYAEDMALDDRVDIEESETFVGLGDFVAGDFACDDT